MASDCVFCSIVRGEAPATKVFEDDHTLAFADIFPLERGHLLVIPKVHVENIDGLDEETGAHLFRVTMRLARRMKQVLRPDATPCISPRMRAAISLADSRLSVPLSVPTRTA